MARQTETCDVTIPFSVRGEDHELRLVSRQAVWDDFKGFYGSQPAYQRESEIIEETYEVDGDPVDISELERLVGGTASAQELINRAYDRGDWNVDA